MGAPSRPEAIQTVLEGGLAILTIDRPAVRNALDTAGWLALRDALRPCASDRAVRAIVLAGAGERELCAGDDLREPFMTTADVRDYGNAA